MGQPIKLGADVLKAIDASLRDLHDLQTEIPRAEAAGVDCTEARARMEDLRAQLEVIRAQYYPGGK